MNKNLIAAFLAALMLLSLCACGTKDHMLDGGGSVKTEPVITAAPGTTTEPEVAAAEPAASAGPDFATMTPAEREAYIRANLPELPEALRAAISETMEAIYYINPGSAGSSLRQTAALGRVLDLAELAGTDTDRSAFTWTCRDWILANLQDSADKVRFSESYTLLFETAGAYFTDPSAYNGASEECGYVFQHTEYNMDLTYWVLDCIAISQAEGE